MMESIKIDDLVLSYPRLILGESRFSSDSSIGDIDKTIEQVEMMEEKLFLVRNNIGDELFNQLSHADKALMAKTAGVIDFGHPIDLDKIQDEIDNYDYSS